MKSKNVFATLLSIIMLCSCRSTEKAIRIDARERFASNIVPQPKIVSAAKNAKSLELFPEDIKIVYGSNSPKCRIGAEEINKHLFKMGFDGRNIPIVSDMEYKKGKEKALIVIGAPNENILAKSLQGNLTEKDGLKSISDSPQGYIIDYVERNNDVPMLFIAGSSPQGTLYGSITLMQLFGKNGDKLLVPPVFVKDWPDFKWRCIGCIAGFFQQSEQAYKFANIPYVGDERIAKEYIDWALKYKINIIRLVPWLNKNQMGTIRTYAEERGVYSFQFYPKISISACIAKEKQENPGKYNGLNNLYKNKCYLTWSRDDLLEPQFREFARQCKKDNVKFCWFHTADAGLTSLNYAQWENRDELDRNNYEDNYGLADSHVISLIQKVFREESPDTKIVYIIYPYTAMVLNKNFPQNIIPDISGAYAEQEKAFIKKYFKTFSTHVSPSIYTCLRETSKENVDLWLKATKHPMLIFFESGRLGFSILNSRARYMKTFYSQKYDNILFYPSLGSSFFPDIESPIEMLLNAEYSWNVNQVGSDYFKKFDFAMDLSEPKVVFEKLIPRACRAYWGTVAGNNFEALFQAGIVPGFLDDPYQFQKDIKQVSGAGGLESAGNDISPAGTEIFFDNPVIEMKRQNEKLQKAIPDIEKWLDSYENKNLDPFSYKYGSMLYLFANYWYYKSLAWTSFLETEDYIIKGEKEKAEKSLLEANAAFKTACNGMAETISKIKGKHLCLIPSMHKEPIYKAISAELKKLEKKYEELRTKTENMKSSLIIHNDKIEKLKQRKYIALRKDKESWENCPYFSDFTLLSSTPPQSAFYQSKIQIMYDEKNIYFRINMAGIPGVKPITGRNTKNNKDFWSRGNEENAVEIFISPDERNFYQFACDATGRKLQFRTLDKISEPLECEWSAAAFLDKGAWTCIASIPWRSLGLQKKEAGQSLRIGIMRQCVNISGSTEVSVICPEMQPRSPSTYPEFLLVNVEYHNSFNR